MIRLSTLASQVQQHGLQKGRAPQASCVSSSNVHLGSFSRFPLRTDVIIPISLTLKEALSFPNSSWTVVVLSRIACTDSSIFKTSVLKVRQNQSRPHNFPPLMIDSRLICCERQGQHIAKPPYGFQHLDGVVLIQRPSQYLTDSLSFGSRRAHPFRWS